MDNEALNKRLESIEDKLDKLHEKLNRIDALIEKQILKTYNNNIIYKSLKNEIVEIEQELDTFEEFISENISTISMNTWILSCDIKETDTEVYLKTPNAFCKGVIEKRYLQICERYGNKIILT